MNKINHKKEFLSSLVIYIPMVAILSYFLYDGNLTKTIMLSCISNLGIFFVPYILKKYKKAE